MAGGVGPEGSAVALGRRGAGVLVAVGVSVGAGVTAAVTVFAGRGVTVTTGVLVCPAITVGPRVAVGAGDAQAAWMPSRTRAIKTRPPLSSHLFIQKLPLVE